jgi:flagellin-like protein
MARDRRGTWRRARARSRGVSEIVATILLVAIGVVLAAVLYVLVTNLTGGPSSSPIGSGFAAGNPVLQGDAGSGASTTCSAATTTLAGALGAGHWMYRLDVESSTVAFGHILLQVRSANGAFDAANVGFFVVDGNGLVLACAGSSGTPTQGSMSSTLSFVYPADAGATSATAVSSAYQLVLDMGSTSPASQGFTFDVVGQGPYSGTTAPVTLP